MSLESMDRESAKSNEDVRRHAKSNKPYTSFDGPLTDSHFKAPICRNCGQPCTTPFCSSCGQKMASRLQMKDVGNQAWIRPILLRDGVLDTGLRLLIYPGNIARSYVFGARKRYMPPFTLLFLAVGLLVLTLGRTQYLVAGQAELTPLMEQVEVWGRWSFTLGLFAIWLSTLIVFWRRLGYNSVEKFILAVYAQVAIISVNLLNLLPLLLLDADDWVVQHREWSGIYMEWVEAGIVAAAIHQFFRIKLLREWWKILVAILLYYLIKRALLFLYSRLIVLIVLGI